MTTNVGRRQCGGFEFQGVRAKPEYMIDVEIAVCGCSTLFESHERKCELNEPKDSPVHVLVVSVSKLMELIAQPDCVHAWHVKAERFKCIYCGHAATGSRHRSVR